MQSNGNAAQRIPYGLVARLLANEWPAGFPANDNGDEPASQAQFEAALRHFAAHGLGAARAARHQAQQAFFAGDRRAYRWWLGICRLLDRRMAILSARRLEATDTTDSHG